jgi:hypothetical protein
VYPDVAITARRCWQVMCPDPSPVVPQSVEADKEPWIFMGAYGTVGVPLYAYTMGTSVAPPGSNGVACRVSPK